MGQSSSNTTKSPNARAPLAASPASWTGPKDTNFKEYREQSYEHAKKQEEEEEGSFAMTVCTSIGTEPDDSLDKYEDVMRRVKKSASSKASCRSNGNGRYSQSS